MIGKCNKADSLLVDIYAALSGQSVDAMTSRNGTVIADRLTHQLKGLQPESCAILQRSAILVCTRIVATHEEPGANAPFHCAVDVDDVKAGGACSLGCRHVVCLQAPDVLLVHCVAGAHPEV